MSREDPVPGAALVIIGTHDDAPHRSPRRGWIGPDQGPKGPGNSGTSAPDPALSNRDEEIGPDQGPKFPSCPGLSALLTVRHRGQNGPHSAHGGHAWTHRRPTFTWDSSSSRCRTWF